MVSVKKKETEYFDKNKYLRVLRLAKTPGASEFRMVATVAGAGVVVLGITGFVIASVMGLVPLV